MRIGASKFFQDDTSSPILLTERQHGFNLFCVGFLVLFFELAAIRWFSTYVVFLQFFTNVVLIASFLGMSCGCLAARQGRDWLRYAPIIIAGTVVAALAMLVVYELWGGIVIDVGHQASPQEVFFGTENRNPDVAKFVIPIEVVAGAFFILIALMFVGLGQVLGRAFEAYPHRVVGYTLNIGGSLAGIATFSLFSFLEAPPAVWMLVVASGFAFLLRQRGNFTWLRAATLATLLVATMLPSYGLSLLHHVVRWSPYYAVDWNRKSGFIAVNTIGHQQMVPFEDAGSPYSLIHLLEKQSGGEPFHDVLVIGAGSGNDLAHALRFGAEHIDAVEIDPVIQDIGVHNHPNHPYQDPRVVRRLDDGRHFLRTTDHKYDLVVYALVDSLILHSGYANIRLESYLFTQEAFNDVKRVLKPGGVFVMYNFFRQGWIVERVAAMSEAAFGCKPLVLHLPYRESIRSSDQVGFATIIAGCPQRMEDAFKGHEAFWLNRMPPQNLAANGFTIDPQALPSAERDQWYKIAPATLIHEGGEVLTASDDWPFLYLRSKLIPDFTIRSILLLGALGVFTVYAFLPKGRLDFHTRMFFLGAGFMLLETKAVVQMALLFGSTWFVNSAVFFTVLILILLANLFVIRRPATALGWHYGGLFLFLAANALVPFDVFLSGDLVWRYAAPSFLALGPMFFAGVIFARTFRDAANPDSAFGSNIAGAVIGGLSEACSTLLGFRHLMLVAIAFYLLSLWAPALKWKKLPKLAATG